MRVQSSYDAIVIGSGPNGLSAAIVLARAGCSVLVVEGQETIGGGTRSAELTLPGFVHDVCSAVHPLGIASPFFRTLPLEHHGLQWIQPPFPLAHPFDEGPPVVLDRSMELTCRNLEEDARSYQALMAPLVKDWRFLEGELLGPLQFPRHPMALARFGWYALQSASGLAKRVFRTERARALFAGLAAHSILPLEHIPSAAIGLVLAIMGHLSGWPIPKGGSQQIANSLASYLCSLGGEIITSWRVESIDELPRARVLLCDVSPRGLLRIAGHRFPSSYRRALRQYHYGPGAYKVDWALRGPIPWTAPRCGQACTVHLGGSLSEIAAAESAAWNEEHCNRPFVLLAQPSLFDSSRAPEGKHTAWAYCHVPNGSNFDMTSRIENQIERFAPGFKDLIIARSVRPPAVLEKDNANLVGGDISGGAANLRQLFWRPTRRVYSTPVKGLYLCSSSTPPGGGVHGMCGYAAAVRALSSKGVMA